MYARYVAILLGIIAFLLAAVDMAPAADPDLANVSDMLNGQWKINPVADLVAANPNYSSPTFDARYMVFWTDNNTISSQKSTQTPITANCNAAPSPQYTMLGRPFNTPNDVVITVSAIVGCGNGSLQAVGVIAQDLVSGAKTELMLETSTVGYLRAVVADLNKDGYDDLIVINQAKIFLVTATDVNDQTKGLTVAGTPLTITSTTQQPLSAPVVGDFDGNGVPEVAWIGGNAGGDGLPGGAVTVYFASVCLTPNAACATNAITLRTSTIPLTTTKQNTSSAQYCQLTSALAAGKFFSDTAGGDTLLIAATVTTKTGVPNDQFYFPTECGVILYSYGFDSNLTPQKTDALSYAVKTMQHANVFATTARLNWFGTQDQVVVAVSGPSFNSVSALRDVLVVHFDELTGSMSSSSSLYTEPSGNYADIWGLAVGKFTSDTSTTAAFNPEIAILRANPAGSGSVDTFNPRLYIYTVPNPATGDYTPSCCADTYELSGWKELTWIQGLGFNVLAAGDLQGHAMRVGPPFVVRITDHLQPKVVLGAPPMHVDYVQSSGASQPTVVNFSAIPGQFNSLYNTSQTNTTTSSTTNTTSYSYSTGETVGVTVKTGIPEVASISTDFQNAWKQTYEQNVSTAYNTYASSVFSVSGTTDFSDIVWYTQSDFNVYYYPVIGQTGCPNGQPNCGAADQQPLYVTLSGPSNTVEYQQEGTSLEWYQPIHEPGNVLSYPWDQCQLQNNFTQTLTSLGSGNVLATDGSTGTFAATWTGSQGMDQTSGTTSTHSYDMSISLTGGTPALEEADAGANVTGKFDYNNSTSVSTLNTNTTTLEASTGVTVTKSDAFRTPALYAYEFQPLLLGQAPPDGAVQTLDPNVNIATSGFLLAAYAADPTTGNNWWQTSPYTKYIDVALNHPSRWAEGTDDVFSSDALPPECLGTSTQATFSQCFTDAATIDATTATIDTTAADLWNNEFYWMKGLFVTVNGTGGPQRTHATEGDTVFLQARVYNYSLKAMPAGTEVHARFYRQAIDNSNTPIGDSVLIEDVVLADTGGNPLTIPPFQGGTLGTTCTQGLVSPNWVMASTSFDTNGLGGQSFIFWVLVWTQDASGALVAELPGHGFSPGVTPQTLTAVTSLSDAPLELVTLTYGSLTNTSPTRTTSFSNNVGFFKQVFYVQAAATPGPLTGAPELSPLLKKPTWELKRLRVTPARVRPNQKVVVSADLVSRHAASEDVLVQFVDRESRRIFDTDMVTHIDAKDTHQISVPYRTASCGTHDIQIIVEPGAKKKQSRTVSFEVQCTAAKKHVKNKQ